MQCNPDDSFVPVYLSPQMEITERHIGIWEECLHIMEQILEPQQFSTWFKPIRPLSLDGCTLTVEVPSDFFREYIESAFLDVLSKTLRRVIGPEARLQYSVRTVKDRPMSIPGQSVPTPENPPVTIATPPSQMPNPFVYPGLHRLKIDPRLKPEYCFDNLVEGECNRLGVTIGNDIADAPGKTAFNPLFIYGGSGLGKTHLAQAIGIAIKENMPKNVVLYVSANIFQTQYMDAVNVKNKLTDFLNFYRFIDTLIIDDVHEFADKPGTQNAFFQIFNHLHQSGKQIILTSDKAPVEMTGLEQRLLSRFKWGLSVELLPPSFETRIEILRAKSIRDGIELPNEILTYLASNVIGNVRELEGTLISLLAHATLSKETITLNLAKSMIDKIVSPCNNEISIDVIRDTTCEYFKISKEDLVSKTRKREISQARQIVMYLGRNLTKKSLASIGSCVGGRDHATVLHACTQVSNLMETDKSFKKYVEEIESRLKPL